MKNDLINIEWDNVNCHICNNDDLEPILKNGEPLFNGQSANTSKWIFSNNQTGTHINLSYYFCKNGKKTYKTSIKDISFDNWSYDDVSVGNVTFFIK